MIWCISGATFSVAGLIMTLDGKTPTGMMNVSVGMLLIIIGLGLGSKKEEGGDDDGAPPT
jgi:hypothetical protein